MAVLSQGGVALFFIFAGLSVVLECCPCGKQHLSLEHPKVLGWTSVFPNTDGFKVHKYPPPVHT